MNNPLRTVLVSAALGCLLSAAEAQTTAETMNTLRRNLCEVTVDSPVHDERLTREFIIASDSGRFNDVLLLQLYLDAELPEAEAERLLGGLRPDGSWNDIDYADKTRGRWNPSLHITRMYALAKLYKNPDSKYYDSQRMSRALHSALAYWCAARPKCPNWWHNEIGVPKKLGPVLVLMKDELSPEETKAALKVMDKSRFRLTGQNKVWLAANILMKAILTEDYELARQARDTICSEIVITTDEGIQPDFSFHQHGPQLQFGNYGLAYVDGMAYIARILRGTSMAFSPEQESIVSDLMKQGIMWSVWKGYMDVSACGRQVFDGGQRGKALAMASAACDMARSGTADSALFSRVAEQNLDDTGHNDLRGGRYFWRSDFGIYRTSRWYGSVRMQSERTIGFEMTNRENLLSNFSADGATMLMVRGDEYDNIFPYWDWRKLPGVTAYDDGKPMKMSDKREDKQNNSRWVGGIGADSLLFTSMTVNRDGLRARKANFFFPGMIVALGCGISMEGEDIRSLTTAMEQNHLRGEVKTSRRKRIAALAPESELTGTFDWIWHDGTGYVPLEKSLITVSNRTQRGLWDYIDPFYKGVEAEGEVFKAYIGHDPKSTGSYAYAVLPCTGEKATASFAEKPKVRILANDSKQQAATDGNVVYAAFFEPGSTKFRMAGRRFTLSVDKPCLLAATITEEEMNIWAADPTQSPEESAVTVRIESGKRAEFGGSFRIVLSRGEADAKAGICGSTRSIRIAKDGTVLPR